MLCPSAFAAAMTSTTTAEKQIPRFARNDISALDQIEQELAGARVVLLADPEHGLLAQLDVPVALRHGEQLVERRVLAPLRQREQDVLLQLLVGPHLVVQRHQLPDVPAVLPGPEDRLLATLGAPGRTARELDEPAHPLGAALLRDRHED